jgi:hypothetical protein
MENVILCIGDKKCTLRFVCTRCMTNFVLVSDFCYFSYMSCSGLLSKEFGIFSTGLFDLIFSLVLQAVGLPSAYTYLRRP